jgi:hypothetical protein
MPTVSNPYQGAVVLVNVDAAHNNGQPLAPALVTAVNGDGTVNVRVQYDAEPAPAFGHRNRPEHLPGVTFYDTADAGEANKAGLYGAFWPQAPSQDLTEIHQEMEKIMAAQDDITAAVQAINTAVASVGAVATDLNTAAANIQAEITALNAQITAAGGTPVDTTALNTAVSALNAAVAPLQQAQAAVDALETPAAPAEPPAPAEGTAGSTVNAGDGGSAA